MSTKSNRIVIEEVQDENEVHCDSTTTTTATTAVENNTTAADATAADIADVVDTTASPSATAASSSTLRKPTPTTGTTTSASSSYYFDVDKAIREDFAAAEALRAQTALENATTITLDTIIKECEKQGFYRTPSCNEKLYLHHKGFTKIAEGAFDPYTDVKVLWLEGNCFANENPKKNEQKGTSTTTANKEGVTAAEAKSSSSKTNTADATTALHSPHIFKSQHATLRQFYLHGNLLMSTPRALAGFTALDSVNLSDNFIESIKFMANPKGLGIDVTTAATADDSATKKVGKKEDDTATTTIAAVPQGAPIDSPDNYEWVDAVQAAWEDRIGRILDGPSDDDEDDDDQEEKEKAKKSAAAVDSPTKKGVSKSSGVTVPASSVEEIESDDNDDGKNEKPSSEACCHLSLAGGDDAANSSVAGAVAANADKLALTRRLRRFQKAIDAAVAMRSVPIPADGKLNDEKGDRWAKKETFTRQVCAETADDDATTSKMAGEATNTTTPPHLSDTVTWIQLKNNHLKSPRDLLQLLTFSRLTSLDLSQNRIENNDGEFFMFLQAMPQLKSLILQGNPCVRQITPQYRKQILKILPNLMYLDDRPVFAEERRMVTAWAVGGADGEKKERLLMKKEEDDKVQQRLAEFRDLMRRGREVREARERAEQQQTGGVVDEVEEPSESESSSSDGSSDADDDVPTAGGNTNANNRNNTNNTTNGPTTTSAASPTRTYFYERNYGPNSADPAPVHRPPSSALQQSRHVDPTVLPGDVESFGNPNVIRGPPIDDAGGVEESAGDAAGTVSWGNYVIRNRNATNVATAGGMSAQQRAAARSAATNSLDEGDDDFDDVVIGH